MDFIVTTCAEGDHITDHVVSLSGRSVDMRAHSVVTAHLTRLLGYPRATDGINLPVVSSCSSPVLDVVRTTKPSGLVWFFASNNRTKSSSLLTQVLHMACPTPLRFFVGRVANTFSAIYAKSSQGIIATAFLALAVLRQYPLAALLTRFGRHECSSYLLVVEPTKSLRCSESSAALDDAGHVSEKRGVFWHRADLHKISSYACSIA